MSLNDLERRMTRQYYWRKYRWTIPFVLATAIKFYLDVLR